MPGPLPRWFAHRGGGSLAAENTLAGIHLAASLGFRAVEFDVMLSRDGTPILMHDETLERTTNGRGRVADASDAVLSRLDAGDGRPPPFLHEAAALCRHYGLLANVEIKPPAGDEVRSAEIITRCVVEAWQGAAVPPLLSSFSGLALDVARTLAPVLRRGLLYEQVPAGWVDESARLGAFSLHCAAERCSADVLAACRELAMPVLCYTVDDPAQAAGLFRSGVSALFTDRLDRFAASASP